MASIIDKDLTTLQLAQLYVGVNSGLRIGLPTILASAQSVTIKTTVVETGVTTSWECVYGEAVAGITCWYVDVSSAQFPTVGPQKYSAQYVNQDGDTISIGTGWITVRPSQVDTPSAQMVTSVNSVSADATGNVTITGANIAVNDADPRTVAEAIASIATTASEAQTTADTATTKARQNAEDIEVLQEDITQIYLDVAETNKNVATAQSTANSAKAQATTNASEIAALKETVANLKLLDGEEYAPPTTLNELIAVTTSAIETLGGKFVTPTKQV